MNRYSGEQTTPLRERKLHILLTEDSAEDAAQVRYILEQDKERSYSLVHCENIKQTLSELRCQPFDLLLLDLNLAEVRGIETLQAITSENSSIPILAISDNDLGKQAIQAGAEDYLPRDALQPALLSRTILYAIERRSLLNQLQHQATTDTLTGLANRNALFQRLEQTVSSAKRQSSKFAVAVMDLDGFRQVNDEYGHSAGDELLQQVASRLTQELRSSDFVARLGGDEFVIVLQHYNNTEELIKVLEKKRDNLIQPVCLSADNEHLSLSVGVSTGVVEWSQSTSPRSLLSFAEKAMSQSKQGGDNHITLARY